MSEIEHWEGFGFSYAMLAVSSVCMVQECFSLLQMI